MVKRIAVCVYGVNGVGKSTILETVVGMHPKAVVIRGSTVLKEALAVASYEALEESSATAKKEAKIRGFKQISSEHPSPIILVDTHLVVPIRRNGVLVQEDMWDDEMLSIFQGFIYISAAPEVVSVRRQIDNERSLRFLNSSPQICAEDLKLNEDQWDAVSSQMPHKKVIINDQSVQTGARKISRFLKTLA